MTTSLRFLAIMACIASIGVTRSAEAEKTIVETAVDAGSFKTLVAAVKAADLAGTLSSPGPFTVFAPTDEAFAKLPEGTVESLLRPENKDQLVAILTHHVVAGRVPASKVVTLSGAKTVGGQRVDIYSDDGGVTVDGANVVQTDINCSNGIVHVIDQVILPVAETIPEVASAAGSFGTLLAAANAAGLVPTLSGEGPFTVFAPTEDAFGALPKGTVAELLKPENKAKLAEILTYHVVSGRVYSEDALTIDTAPTVAGPAIKVTLTEAGAKINDARLLQTDIDASNGVIHVIDRVLLPSKAASSHSTNGRATVQAARPSMDSRAIARGILTEAIQRGVPIFNAGDHGQCSQIYMDALQSVAAMQGLGLSDSSMQQVTGTLKSCAQMQSVTNRAWALRMQMDRLNAEL